MSPAVPETMVIISYEQRLSEVRPNCVQVSQSWKTRQVTSIEAFSPGGPGLPGSLEIQLAGSTLSSKDHLAFQLTGPAEGLDAFLGSFVLFFRSAPCALAPCPALP